MSKNLNLFSPVVPDHKLHPNFVLTLKNISAGVRDVLNDWAIGFHDRDGKFIHEFQTTYNSGFWELYLFAVLKYLKVDVDFSYSSPDFVCSKNGLVIEAAIASHSVNDIPEWKKDIRKLGDEELYEMYRSATIRLSNAFNSKDQKYRNLYSNLSHVKDKAFIIAISNYTRSDFIGHGDVPMQWLLYDPLNLGHLKKENGAEVPLGIFKSDTFSDVSAVLYSSLATFGKARAVGNDTKNFEFTAIRIKDNFDPILIKKNKSDYKESLCDGLRLFVNPHAKNIIQLKDFDDIGIRTFLLEKDESLNISCHPDGDLCMRVVKQPNL